MRQCAVDESYYVSVCSRRDSLIARQIIMPLAEESWTCWRVQCSRERTSLGEVQTSCNCSQMTSSTTVQYCHCSIVCLPVRTVWNQREKLWNWTVMYTPVTALCCTASITVLRMYYCLWNALPWLLQRKCLHPSIQDPLRGSRDIPKSTQ